MRDDKSVTVRVCNTPEVEVCEGPDCNQECSGEECLVVKCDDPTCGRCDRDNTAHCYECADGFYMKADGTCGLCLGRCLECYNHESKCANCIDNMDFLVYKDDGDNVCEPQCPAAYFQRPLKQPLGFDVDPYQAKCYETEPDA